MFRDICVCARILQKSTDDSDSEDSHRSEITEAATRPTAALLKGDNKRGGGSDGGL